MFSFRPNAVTNHISDHQAKQPDPMPSRRTKKISNFGLHSSSSFFPHKIGGSSSSLITGRQKNATEINSPEPTVAANNGAIALSSSGDEANLQRSRSTVSALSDNGTVQPETNRWALRVINPDPDSSSEDEDDDCRSSKRHSISVHSYTAPSSTKVMIDPTVSGYSEIPSLQPSVESASSPNKLIKPTTPIPAAHALIDESKEAHLPFLTPATSFSLATPEKVESPHHHDVKQQDTHYVAPETRLPLTTTTRPSQPLSRRQSKVLQEQPPATPLPLDWLPQFDFGFSLLPSDTADFLSPSFITAQHNNSLLPANPATTYENTPSISSAGRHDNATDTPTSISTMDGTVSDVPSSVNDSIQNKLEIHTTDNHMKIAMNKTPVLSEVHAINGSSPTVGSSRPRFKPDGTVVRMPSTLTAVETENVSGTNYFSGYDAIRHQQLSDGDTLALNSEPAPPSMTSLSNASVTMMKTTDSLASMASTQTSSKYAKASYSLTNHPDAIKLYRNMALKTGDKKVQLSYAKYLLEIADLYECHPSHRASKHMSGFHQNLLGELGGRMRRGEGIRHSVDAKPASPAMSQLSALYSQPRTSTSTMRASIDIARPIISGTDYESNRRKKKVLEEEGVRWIRRLAKERVAEAAYLQALWMDCGLYGFKKNPAKSLKYYEIAAREGVPEAMYAVAEYYASQGYHAAAFANYKRAADKGFVDAIYRLGLINLHGYFGQRQNMTAGLQLLYEAAGNATESCNEPPYVFALLLTNTYPKADIPSELVKPYGGANAAVNFFERAAQLAHVAAQTRLAYIYEHGLYGVPMNFAKSFTNYELAANAKDTDAMVGLSRLYNNGSHGPKDHDEEKRRASDESGWLINTNRDEDAAFMWCQRAADQESVEGLFLLGWYYETGTGTLRDYERAQTYYRRAASKGHAEAKERLQKTNSTTRQQHEEMKRLMDDGQKDLQACSIM
ncbi:uncharacterized protein BYT42DRAFT_551931 [Radiomyces spectabilis]|uniref:uncharacterized protein n=1 Tax=Radiomyces spectabilis TaxID=64574 RepID=UPI002220B87B|nr:uncharacterized protein BYT42DRAFT_551931 [Radiomyces spectabilis]KAI8393696.1 hypothetical protein BYT42DRAFT_551931 [Radiomyces spectabilis]